MDKIEQGSSHHRTHQSLCWEKGGLNKQVLTD